MAPKILKYLMESLDGREGGTFKMLASPDSALLRWIIIYCEH
jgi:hypothetical protein